MAATPRPRRSALYMPASNPRAVEKARTLECDVVILDLEDAVLPESKDAARDALQRHAKAIGASELSVPTDIRVIDSIPLLGTGKIDYVAASALAKTLTESAAQPSLDKTDAA